MSDEIQHPIAIDPQPQGTQEIEDVIDCVDAVVDVIKEVTADKTVTTVELLAALVKLTGPLKKAVEGASKIVAEGKDLDSAEVARLAGKLYAIGEKIVK